MRKTTVNGGVTLYGEECLKELKAQAVVVLNELTEKGLALSGIQRAYRAGRQASVDCKLQLPGGRKVTLHFELDTRGGARHGNDVVRVSVNGNLSDHARKYTFTRCVTKGLTGMTDKVMKLVNYNLAYQDKRRAEGQARCMKRKAA